MILKGLAQAWGDPADIELLKPDWWYNWQVGDLSDPAYVPMLRNGLADINLPEDYSGYVLVFNEPNLPEPNGCNIPDYMAGIVRYAVLAHLYPDAKFIVGGVSAWKWGWLVRFHKMAVRCKLRLPTGYHIHGYANDYGTLKQMFTWWITARNQIKAITHASEFWVTETSDMEGNPAILKSILERISAYGFERGAVYTNRQPEGAGWAINKAVELVDENGLTPMGITFVEA
jgi:hypothetical protein